MLISSSGGRVPCYGLRHGRGAAPAPLASSGASAEEMLELRPGGAATSFDVAQQTHEHLSRGACVSSRSMTRGVLHAVVSAHVIERASPELRQDFARQLHRAES